MNPKILIGMMGIIILISGCIQEQISKDKGEFFIYPEEYIIYQDYIKTIIPSQEPLSLGGIPRIHDTGTIEATVISISKTEVCPYAEETCSIEPYPKDFGIVRIDKIINYTPYSEQTAEQPIEQQSGGEVSEEGKTTPGYKGQEPPKPKLPEYESLQEGQEVSTHFLLTVRPVKVRYVPINESKGGLESAQLLEGTQQTVSQQVEPGKKTFKPIPKDGDYFVFTTKIGKFPGIIEKILPGLEVGSKFRAEIYWDGSLYVEEYEIKR